MPENPKAADLRLKGTVTSWCGKIHRLWDTQERKLGVSSWMVGREPPKYGELRIEDPTKISIREIDGSLGVGEIAHPARNEKEACVQIM